MLTDAEKGIGCLEFANPFHSVVSSTQDCKNFSEYASELLRKAPKSSSNKLEFELEISVSGIHNVPLQIKRRSSSIG